jgi:hypothetical protein
MKLIRINVLLVFAALAAVALLGAAPASATTLCKAEEEVCAEGNRYPAGTGVKMELATGSTSQIKTSLGTVVCKGSTGEGESTEESTGSRELALDILIKVGFTSCSLGKTSCTLEVPRAWLILVLFLFTFPFFHGKIEKDPTTKGEANINVKCGSLFNCVYNVENALLGGEDGAPASLAANEITLLTEGEEFICPATSKWTAKYTITEPNPLWVSPEP